MEGIIVIDGKILLLGAVLILWLIDFFIRTVNVWLENDMLRKKFDYKNEREKKVYELLNEKIRSSGKAIINQLKSVSGKIVKEKRRLLKKILIQEW